MKAKILSKEVRDLPQEIALPAIEGPFSEDKSGIYSISPPPRVVVEALRGRTFGRFEWENWIWDKCPNTTEMPMLEVYVHDPKLRSCSVRCDIFQKGDPISVEEVEGNLVMTSKSETVPVDSIFRTEVYDAIKRTFEGGGRLEFKVRSDEVFYQKTNYTVVPMRVRDYIEQWKSLEIGVEYPIDSILPVQVYDVPMNDGTAYFSFPINLPFSFYQIKPRIYPQSDNPAHKMVQLELKGNSGTKNDRIGVYHTHCVDIDLAKIEYEEIVEDE